MERSKQHRGQEGRVASYKPPKGRNGCCDYEPANRAAFNTRCSRAVPLTTKSQPAPRIAPPSRPAAHDDPDQPVPVAYRRGREIEARRVDETSLDAVEPGIPVEQVIVVAHLVTAEREGARTEILAFARELAVERQSELRDVARRRALVRIGEPGGVVINGRVHPELTRFRSHLRREHRFAAAQRFGQHDGRVIRRFRYDAEDQILHRYRFAGIETELRWRAACRVIRHLEILVEPQPSPVERLE